jgi:hypothetical protein
MASNRSKVAYGGSRCVLPHPLEVRGQLHILDAWTPGAEVGGSTRYPLNRRLEGPQSRSGQFGEQKNVSELSQLSSDLQCALWSVRPSVACVVATKSGRQHRSSSQLWHKATPVRTVTTFSVQQRLETIPLCACSAKRSVTVRTDVTHSAIGRRQLERPWCRWKYNTNWCLNERPYAGLIWLRKNPCVLLWRR